MDLQQLINSLYSDTVLSTEAFRPELALCATIVLILLLRIIGLTSRLNSFWVAFGGALVALWFAAPWQNLEVLTQGSPHVVAVDTAYYRSGPQQGRPPEGTFKGGTRVEVLAREGSYWQVRAADGTRGHVPADAIRHASRQEIFTGMLVYDNFTVYFRVVLLLFAVLFTIFTRISGIPDKEAAPDFYPLVLGGTLGMCLMVSANHLLMVFLGVEMASVPSYALAGALKGRRQSSEAALKYAVYGAGAAGVMLYGISLLAGILGSVHIPTMTVRLAELLQSGAGTGGDKTMVLVLGTLMVMVGLAFKLSAVPFHFWCPDVFEGASAEVDAFLSVASKAAALALLVRLAIGFSHLPEDVTVPRAQIATVAATAGGATHQLAVQRTSAAASDPVPLSPRSLEPVRQLFGSLLAVIAAITCTFGNLAAYGQTNIKRLLAYSTIAHAGYMIMPVAAAVLLSGSDPAAAEKAIGALTIYVAIYLFMNLGAFAVVAFVRNELRSEEIADYAGLVRRSPVMVVCFALLLVSLIGLPPLAGFTAKFQVFAVLVQANLWTLLWIAGINTVISLFYYIRVVKVMTIEPEPAHRVPTASSFIPATFVVAITIPVLVFGIWWDGLTNWARAAAMHLMS